MNSTATQTQMTTGSWLDYVQDYTAKMLFFFSRAVSHALQGNTDFAILSCFHNASGEDTTGELVGLLVKEGFHVIPGVGVYKGEAEASVMVFPANLSHDYFGSDEMYLLDFYSAKCRQQSIFFWDAQNQHAELIYSDPNIPNEIVGDAFVTGDVAKECESSSTFAGETFSVVYKKASINPLIGF